MRKLCVLLFILIFLLSSIVKAQNVGINDDGSAPNASAMLDVKSGTKGMLIPRVALTGTNSATPVSSPLTSLLVYNTATAGSGTTAVTPGFYYWNISSWEKISSSSTVLNAWSLTGNAGTTAGTNFIGTTDEQPLAFKVNNMLAGFIHPTNQNTSFGIGTPAFITGASNTAIGNSALFSNTSGSANTATGVAALYYNTTGQGNTAAGVDALYVNTTENDNTAMGYLALFQNTVSANTAVGSHSMFSNTTGSNNTAVGFEALYANTSAGANTAHGFRALKNNIAGANNVAVGSEALMSNNSGTENTATGTSALSGNTTGNFNTASGFEALKANTTAGSNTAHGFRALKSNTTGNANTAFGTVALASNTTADFNTAVGNGSLVVNVDGQLNVAVGYSALGANTSGTQNTAIGSNALLANIDGNQNTALGLNANVAAGNLTNATAIGYGTIVDASNKVRIGNGDVTVIEGAVSFTTPSDGRFKFNVRDDVRGLDFILKLRPVTYQLDTKRLNAYARGEVGNGDYIVQASYNEASSLRRTGFIAQEVEAAANESGFDFSGINKPKSPTDHYSLSYDSFVVPLVKAMQEQQVVIEKQNDELKKLKDQVEALTKAVQNLSSNK